MGKINGAFFLLYDLVYGRYLDTELFSKIVT